MPSASGIKKYCPNCKITLKEEEFYKTKDPSYKDGRVDLCKKCFTVGVNNWDPETFKPLLKICNVPYVKREWDSLLTKYSQRLAPREMTSYSIFGRYLAKMSLVNWKDYRWEDTEKIQQDIEEKARAALRRSGLSDEEVEAQIIRDRTEPVPMPKEYEELYAGVNVNSTPVVNNTPVMPESNSQEEDLIDDDLGLTDDDKIYLRLKWGSTYLPEEWVHMEQFYKEMEESYDIQTAGHRDTLKLICKTSLKANQLLDSGDIDGYQKLSRVYDQLMKSGKFQAIQNKGMDNEFIDSIGELVAICEKDGFIPKFYTDGPQDKVDRTIQDIQSYTKTLITEEMGLGDKIESAAKLLLETSKNEYNLDDADSEETFEDDLFSDNAKKLLEYEDYQDMLDFEQEQADQDEAYIKAILDGDIKAGDF